VVQYFSKDRFIIFIGLSKGILEGCFWHKGDESPKITNDRYWHNSAKEGQNGNDRYGSSLKKI